MDPAPRTGWLGVAYETVMVSLAIAVVATLAQPDEGAIRVVNWIIWGVFVTDYVLRLAFSGDRWRFVRSNVIDLVAIVPVAEFRAARVLRVVRILRLLRSAAVLWRVSATVRAVVGTNGLGWVLSVTGLVVLISAGAVLVTEPGFGTFGDAVWWSIVTSTTVGYGDLAPETIIGRAIAVVLMFVGIGTLGMITGSIATHFIHGRRHVNPHIEHLQGVLDGWDDLDATERRQAVALLQALVSDDDLAAVSAVDHPQDGAGPT